jgi:hypothetical protein
MINKQWGKSIIRLASAGPDFFLASVFAAHWINREWLDYDITPHLVSVLLIESVVIHASAFMMAASQAGPEDKIPRGKAMIALGSFYTIFAGAISLGFGSLWPLLMFWGLMVNRGMTFLLAGNEKDSPRCQKIFYGNWALSTLAFIVMVVSTSVLPIPQLDAAQSLSSYGIDAEGGWNDDPERALAAGMLYFGFLGLLELFGERYLDHVKFLDPKEPPWLKKKRQAEERK